MERSSTDVNDHDFRSAAKGIGIPHGIYDPRPTATLFSWDVSRNYRLRGLLPAPVVAKWKDTSAIRNPATSSSWPIPAAAIGHGAWKGTSAATVRWTGAEDHRFSLPVRCLKWNPIEHRLFSQISKNWGVEPLDNYEKALKFIRTAKTTTGLKVTARLHTTGYPTGVKVSRNSRSGRRVSCQMELHDLTPDVN